MLSITFLALAGCALDDRLDSTDRATVRDGCHVAGCSSQLCVDAPAEIVTDCEWRAEYACYQTAVCERQDTGACGWTATPSLVECIATTED